MRRSTTRLTVVLALAGGVGSASAQTDVSIELSSILAKSPDAPIQYV